MPCDQVHCRDAKSMSCWQNFGSFPSNFSRHPLQYFQIVNLADCLSSWYRLIINNHSNIKNEQLFYSWFGSTEFFVVVRNWQSYIVHFPASFQGCISRPMYHHLWLHGPKYHLTSPKGLGKLWFFFWFWSSVSSFGTIFANTFLMSRSTVTSFLFLCWCSLALLCF